MGKNSPSKKRYLERMANRPYPGFTCMNCGHPDYLHFMWAGQCEHNKFRPKDNSDCNCKEMK